MTEPPEKRETRELFGKVASRYRTSIDHTDPDDRKILISWLSLSPSHVVLDVATGGGHTAAAFASRVH